MNPEAQYIENAGVLNCLKSNIGRGCFAGGRRRETSSVMATVIHRSMRARIRIVHWNLPRG